MTKHILVEDPDDPTPGYILDGKNLLRVIRMGVEEGVKQEKRRMGGHIELPEGETNLTKGSIPANVLRGGWRPVAALCSSVKAQIDLQLKHTGAREKVPSLYAADGKTPLAMG